MIKLMRLILLFFLISTAVFGQDTKTTKFPNWQEYIAGPDYPAKITRKGIVPLVLELPDTSTYEISITLIKKVWVYDSTWVTTEYNNTSSAIAYSAGWLPGAGQIKFYNQDFQYGASSTIPRSLTFTYTTDKPAIARFWSERFGAPNPHGKYRIKVDGGPETEIDAGVAPFGSDKDRNLASWETPLLPAGTHTITLTTSAQMVVDRFTVSALTLVPR